MRVIRCFLDADLRCSAPGLVDMCRKEKLKVEKLPIGQIIAFVNSKKNQIKVLACNESTSPVVASYKMPEGRIYDLRIISKIPEAFQGGRVDFDSALKKVLAEHFARKRGVYDET